MNRIKRNRTYATLATALAAILAGCSAPGTNADSSVQPTDEQTTEATEVVSRQQEAPDAGGRIDVTQTGAQLATFDGPKYIVSDATVDQTAGEAFGVQEICVVSPTESWGAVGSIGWDRNSISYNNMATEWGKLSYRFEYINEAGSDTLDATWSRTTEAGFFGEGVEVSHASVAGHDVAYVLNDDAVYEIAPGISDLEAQASGQLPANSFVTVHAWESRGEACAFATSISCEIDENADVALEGEQLLADAYAALDFLKGDAGEVDAASFESDLTLLNADGSKQLVVKRDGATLLGYTSHSVTLANFGEGNAYSTMTMDFAPEGGLDAMADVTSSLDEFSPDYGYTDAQVSEVEEHEVDGLAVSARVASASLSMGEQGQTLTRELRAWADVGGDALYVQTTLQEDEDVEAALSRVLAGRVELA